MAEEEQQKKSGRKKRTRTPTKNAGIAPGPMYPSGTPVNPQTGLPYQDAPINPRVAEQIGYDAESARVNAVMGHVRKRKEAGDTNLRFDAPDHVKYQYAVTSSPGAWVRFQQIEPVKDDNIPTKTIAALDSLDKAVEFLARNHWNGKRAAYKWYIFDQTNYQKVTGRIDFAEREESDMQNQQPPGGQFPGYPGYPPQGFPPQQPGYPPQGYGAPPGYPPMWGAPPMAPMPPMMPMMYPMPVAQQQQAAPPPAAQPQAPQMPQMPPMMPPGYPPPAMDPQVVNMLLTLTRENATLVEEVKRAAQQPHQYPMPQIPPHLMPWLPYMMMGYNPYSGYQQQQTQTPQNQTPPEPEKPKSPMELMRESLAMMTSVASMGRKFASEFGPDEPEKPATETPQNEDQFPFAVKEYPHMRVVANKDGSPVDATTVLMHNGDKVAEAARGFFREIRDSAKDFFNEREKMRDREVERQRQRQELQEESLQQGQRMVQITEQMQRLGVSGPPQQNATPPSPNGSGSQQPG
jgi:hypothetical protein